MLPSIAWSIFPMYEIAFATIPDGTIYGLNNAGDYVFSRSGGYTLVRGGISHDFSYPTGNSAFPTGFATGIGDNGVCFGLTNSAGAERRAAAWSVENGWQVMPSGPFRSEAVGITTGNRVLCKGADGFSEPLLAGWWQVGQNPISISGSLNAAACDNEGNAVFFEGFGSTLIRADGTRIVLKYNDLKCRVEHSWRHQNQQQGTDRGLRKRSGIYPGAVYAPQPRARTRDHADTQRRNRRHANSPKIPPTPQLLTASPAPRGLPSLVSSVRRSGETRPLCALCVSPPTDSPTHQPTGSKS